MERPAHPYPVFMTALFGGSFLAFLALADTVRAFGTGVIWAWSIVQILLGAELMRQRLRARRRVSRCIRCGVAVP